MTTMPDRGGTPLRYASRSIEGPPDKTIDALRDRLRGRTRKELRDAGARQAAVLVPIFAMPSGLQVLFFERTHEVLEHKGEICLPGGSIEAGDAGPIEAALREANEELGIPERDVTVLGLLDDVNTMVSNYVITPVVGYLATAPVLRLQALEVARPIAVGLRELVESGVERFELRGPDGKVRRIYAYHVAGDRIWGATARIIHGMLSLWFGHGGEAS